MSDESLPVAQPLTLRGMVATCVGEPIPHGEQLRARYRALLDKIRELNMRLTALRPIEKVARGEIQAEIEKTRALKTALEEQAPFALLDLSEKVKELSPEIFKLRQPSGWPLLAAFTLDSTLCEFKVTGNGRGAQPAALKVIMKTGVYDDVYERLRQKAGRWGNASIRTEFSGVIPPEIKEQIDRMAPAFDSVLILAEAPEWKLDVTERTFPDPLVVGVIKNRYYLIAIFDVTPTERYVGSEFQK